MAVFKLYYTPIATTTISEGFDQIEPGKNEGEDVIPAPEIYTPQTRAHYDESNSRFVVRFDSQAGVPAAGWVEKTSAEVAADYPTLNQTTMNLS
jgi:hypothetical protein